MMTAKTKRFRLLRLFLSTWPRRIAFVMALCVLLPVDCSAILHQFSTCENHNLDVSESNLYGTYKGPHGMKIELAPPKPDALPQDNSLRVENWPLHLSDLNSDGEVEPDFTGKARLINGPGTWVYSVEEDADGVRFPQISLGFDEPTDDQSLMVGGSPENPSLSTATESGSCGVTEFRR